MSTLFEHAGLAPASVPLAERMRPQSLDDLLGQPSLAQDSALRAAIEAGEAPSLVLWGPPGSGKTTLAHLIAKGSGARHITLSAVSSGVADVRAATERARQDRRLGAETLLFIDEVHRFSKAQQDALLPSVEAGDIRFIGATTENPSFAVNNALLSRVQVVQMRRLEEPALEHLLRRALHDAERGIGSMNVNAEDDALAAIAAHADGDARRALLLLEQAANDARRRKAQLDLAAVRRSIQGHYLTHDRSGEQHYNVTSAFIKSLRGSDSDAALYWMMRLLEAGEDPAFVMRRMLIFASEDVGNADSTALQVAVAADHAVQRLGMPEALHSLAQCCCYLACAPKCNASYKGWKKAQEAVHEKGALPVPLHLRNPVTKLMKDAGYGDNYRYPHDEGGYSEGVVYLPDELAGETSREGARGEGNKRSQKLAEAKPRPSSE